MASEYNVVLQLQLQGPSNASQVLAQLQRQLAGVNTSVRIDTSSLSKANSGLSATNAAMRSLQAQASGANATLSGTVKVLNDGSAGLANFAAQAGLAARRFVAFTAATAGIYALVNGIREGIRAAIDFDLAMNKVAQVSDDGAGKVAEIRSEITKLSTSLGVSSKELAEVAITIKQAGLNGQDTINALRAIAKTDLAPSFDNMKQSTEGLIATFRQFKLESNKFEEALGSINAVSAAFAVESQDIISAIQKAGGAFASLSGSVKDPLDALNEFQSLFTSVRATTRESAESIATGLRTIFTRLQRNDTVTALKDLGINLRYTKDEISGLGDDLENQFVGPYEAVKRLSQGLEGLRTTDPRYSAVLEQLGGYRQISRVIPLLKQFEDAEKAKNVAIAGGISLQAAAEKRQEATANQIARVKEEYLSLSRKIFESSGFQALTNNLLQMANGFAQVLDFARPLLPLLTTLAAIKFASAAGSIYNSFRDSFTANVGSAARRPTKFARGGVVPGVGNTDSVPAMLQPGEFVIRKKSAQSVGYDALHQMNAGNYASGGRIRRADRERLRNNFSETGKTSGFVFRGIPGTGSSLHEDRVESGNITYKNLQKRRLKTVVGVEPFIKSANRIEGTVDHEDHITNWATGRILKSESTGKFPSLTRRLENPGHLYENENNDRLGSELISGARAFNNNTDGFGDHIRKENRRYASKYIATLLRKEAEQPLTSDTRSLLKAFASDKHGRDMTTGLVAADAIEEQSPEHGQLFRKLVTEGFQYGRFASGGSISPKKFTTINEAVRSLNEAKWTHPNSSQLKESITQYADTIDGGATEEEYASYRKRNIFKSKPAGQLRNQLLYPIGEVFDELVKTGHRADAKSLLVFARGLGGKMVSRKGRNYSYDRDKHVLDKPGPGGDQSEGSSVKALRSNFGVWTPDGVKTETKTLVSHNGKRFASGGASTDTVPAMLTPGEFVLNRNAAAHIGAANLDRMNKGGVAHFATGGPVGDVPETGSSLPKIVSDVTASLKTLSTVIQGVVSEIKPLSARERLYAKINASRNKVITTDTSSVFSSHSIAEDIGTKNREFVDTTNFPAQSLTEAQLRGRAKEAERIAAERKSKQVVQEAELSAEEERKQREAIDKTDEAKEFAEKQRREGGNRPSRAKQISSLNAEQQALVAEHAAYADRLANRVASRSGLKVDSLGAEIARNEASDTLIRAASSSNLKRDDEGKVVGFKKYLAGAVYNRVPDALTKNLGANFSKVGLSLEERRGDTSLADSLPSNSQDPADIVANIEQAKLNAANVEKAKAALGIIPTITKQNGTSNDYAVARAVAAHVGVSSSGKTDEVFKRIAEKVKSGLNLSDGDGGKIPPKIPIAPAAGGGEPPRDPFFGLGPTTSSASPKNRTFPTTDISSSQKNGLTTQDLLFGVGGSPISTTRSGSHFPVETPVVPDIHPLSGGRNGTYRSPYISGTGDINPSALALHKSLVGRASISPEERLRAADEKANEYEAKLAKLRFDQNTKLLGRDPAGFVIRARQARDAQSSTGAAADLSALQRGFSSDLKLRSSSGGEPPVRPAKDERRNLQRLIGSGNDTLAIKEAAIRAFQSGNGGKDVLDHVRGILSPAQYAQVAKQAEAAGFTGAASAVGGYKVSGIDAKGGSVQKTIFAANIDHAKQQLRNNDVFITGASQIDLNPALKSQGKASLIHDNNFEKRVDVAAQKAFAARGGAALLSNDTQSKLRETAIVAEETRVKRELISAETALLKAIYPEMVASERRKIVTEKVAAALAGQEAVIRSSGGAILGTAGSVGTATSKGIAAPGASALGTRFGEAKASLGAFFSDNRLARFNERNKDFGRGFATPALIGLPLVAGHLEASAGEATVASGSKYTNRKGLAGALQGAVVGGTVGAAVGGPIGAAVGAAAGGIFGFVTSLNEAEKDIRNVKIGNALTELSDRLQQISNTVGDKSGISPAAAASARENLAIYKKESSDRSFEETRSSFSSFNVKEYLERNQRSLRQDLGGQLPALSQTVQKSAEILGSKKENIGRKPEELLAELGSLNSGLNQEFIELIARVRNLPVGSVLEEFKKTIINSQRNAQIAEQSLASRKTGEVGLNTFGRLLLSVQASSDSLSQLQHRAQSLAEEFDGIVSAGRVSSHPEALEQLGRNDKAALTPLDLIAKIGGEQGQRLRDAGGAVDQVSNVLPGVISSVLAEGPKTESDLTTNVTNRLIDTLGYKRDAVPPEVQTILNNITNELNKVQGGGRGVVGVHEETSIDVSKFAEKLLGSSSDPIKDIGGRIAKQLDDEANKISGGLDRLYKNLQTINQNYDELASLQVERAKTVGQFAADAAGRSHEGARLPLGVSNYAFDSRQRRLTAGQKFNLGDRAFDPAAIAEELNDSKARVGVAEGKRNRIYKEDGPGPKLIEATDAVLRFKQETLNLTQALEHLSHVSERNAAAQERLQKLGQEKDSRRSFAERLITADPAERNRIHQGILLTNAAGNKGSLDGLLPGQQRQVIETLNSLGSATLPGVKGAPQANDLKNQLLENSFGGAAKLTPEQQKEEASLKDVVVKNFADGEKARGELIKSLEGNSKTFFENLAKQNETFLTKLGENLARNKEDDTKVKVGKLGEETGKLKELAGHRKTLEDAGVGDDNVFKNLVGNKSSLDKLVTSRDEASKIRARFAIAAGDSDYASTLFSQVYKGIEKNPINSNAFKDSAFGDLAKQRLAKNLNYNGFSNDETAKIIEKYETYARDKIGYSPLGNGKISDHRGVLEQSFSRAVSDLAGDATNSIDAKKLIPAENDLRKIGIDPARIPSTEEGIKKLYAALEKISAQGVKFSDIPNELKKKEEEFKAASAIGKAAGGSIFAPRGTDTVPAMLTPGEFVVSRAAAQANLPLLKKINASRGMHLAGGGEIPLTTFDAYGKPKLDTDVAAVKKREQAAIRQAAKDAARADHREKVASGEYDAEADLKYQAAVNPYGASASHLFRRSIEQEKHRLTKRIQDQKAAVKPGEIAKFNAVIKKQQALPAAFARLDALAAERAGANNLSQGIQAFNRERLGRGGIGTQSRLLNDYNNEQFRQTNDFEKFNRGRVSSQEFRFPIRGFASGGHVSSSDTVAAMLTPGEFVLNRGAVNRAGGPAALQHFNDGGVVSGGSSSVSSSGDGGKQFANAIATFGQATKSLSQFLTGFGGHAQALTEAMNNMPRSIKGDFTHTVSMNLNGAEVLSRLSPEIKKMVVEEAKTVIAGIFKEHLPDAGVKL